MKNNCNGLSRRKFIIAGSATLASPLLLNAAGALAATGTNETGKTEIVFAPKGTKIYYINDECIGCQVCRTFCPAGAIRFGNRRNEIDQKKCIHCGTCHRECNISVISETVLS